MDRQTETDDERRTTPLRKVSRLLLQAGHIIKLSDTLNNKKIKYIYSD